MNVEPHWSETKQLAEFPRSKEMFPVLDKTRFFLEQNGSVELLNRPLSPGSSKETAQGAVIFSRGRCGWHQLISYNEELSCSFVMLNPQLGIHLRYKR